MNALQRSWATSLQSLLYQSAERLSDADWCFHFIKGKTMKLNNQYSTETKLEIFGILCEFFSVREILEQFPHLKLSESSGYAFLSRNHLPTVKRAFTDRRKEAEARFKEKEENLKLSALSHLQKSLAQQGVDY